ncbi:energy transducer TonB [Flavobacterium sp. J372]|uniref:energy transducer TonB n=1 Tax=Flavobacterium sp. J372 TaxID=2898436 RepID=UPI0021509B3A|nr:energy transducer TonB [Flavobacterium sp. J372]MCR5861741.1 energy transducer TonB [Flavobacterium sp. J372]
MKNFTLIVFLLLGYTLVGQEIYLVKIDSLSKEKKIDILPQYPGGIQSFYSDVKEKLLSAKFKKSQIIYATFIVEKDGSLSDIVISENCEPKMKKKFRKLLEQSKWTPGYLNGKPARVRFKLPVTVRSSYDGGVIREAN